MEVERRCTCRGERQWQKVNAGLVLLLVLLVEVVVVWLTLGVEDPGDWGWYSPSMHWGVSKVAARVTQARGGTSPRAL